MVLCFFFFFFSSRRRHTRLVRDWSSDVCSSDLLINEAKENNTILITTEKDYFRIDENYKKNINYLKIAVDIKNRNQLIEEIKKII